MQLFWEKCFLVLNYRQKWLDECDFLLQRIAPVCRSSSLMSCSAQRWFQRQKSEVSVSLLLLDPDLYSVRALMCQSFGFRKFNHTAGWSVHSGSKYSNWKRSASTSTRLKQRRSRLAANRSSVSTRETHQTQFLHLESGGCLLKAVREVKPSGTLDCPVFPKGSLKKPFPRSSSPLSNHSNRF